MGTQNVSGPSPTMGHAEGEGVTVTPAAIEEAITGVYYFTAAEGVIGAKVLNAQPVHIPPALRLLTFCVLTLRNSFTVTGQSACADPKKYNQEIGEKVAYGDAFRQVWPLLGYQLRDHLYNLEKQGHNDQTVLGEALTRMLAHRLGNPEAFRTEDAEAIIAHFENGHAAEGSAS